MGTKVIGVIGAIAGLAVVDQAQASSPATPTPDPMSARSFADLLGPIPNAVAALRAADAAAARDARSTAAVGEERGMQVAGMHHHHHHHHSVPKPKPKPKPHHHHHHHHHHFST